MFHPKHYFTLLPRLSSSILLPALVVSMICVSSRAQEPANLEKKAETPVEAPAEEKKSLLKLGWASPPPKAVINARPDGKGRGDRNVDILADAQREEPGNVLIATGNVQVSDGLVLIIADRITYNKN